ncbi:recombinase RecT [Bdellovibrio sp. ArHS]|uniref:recombinase RecT n=1 Tax=Bdellovibrio sp. ArHS TaxID=1569284 RepID=UPI000B15C948|nr:recombinase RecT [Bdellovibrio sp. ArHS]
MSNLTLFQKSESLIMAQAKKFVELAKSHKAVNFEQEAHFALQALKANSFLADTAAKNPDSLINAVHNIASVGLSLNPALKHAYLVPRDGKVCLDFGYKGLVHLAVDSGSVIFAQAEIVYEKDDFVIKGRGQEPIHNRNPFAKDRGAILGAYCVAKLSNGDFLVETMSVDEIETIRDKTQAYKAFKAGKAKSAIWDTDFAEMAKKTIIRRASKSWPMSNAGRVETATKIQDEGEMAIDVSPVSVEATPQIEGPNPQFQKIRDLLDSLGKEESKFIGYLSTVNNRKIEAIEDLSQKEIDAALVQLCSWAKATQKKETQNENA